jgi:PilZ domain
MSNAADQNIRLGLRKIAVAPAPTSGPTPQIAADRRRHARFEVNLAGRFMRADKQDHACHVTSISVGGAVFNTPVAVSEGERIVAYLDNIGGIEGVVARTSQDGFALRIAATQHKREKIAAQITWLINRCELEGMDARRPGHERITSTEKKTILRMYSGEEVEVRLQELSISGASVLVANRPPLGTEVTIGKLRALVARHHAEGVGVQFVDIQNPEALRRTFG